MQKKLKSKGMNFNTISQSNMVNLNLTFKKPNNWQTHRSTINITLMVITSKIILILLKLREYECYTSSLCSTHSMLKDQNQKLQLTINDFFLRVLFT